MILPTEITGYRGREIAPQCFLISNPKFNIKLQKWVALANIGGSLCLIELRAYLDLTNINFVISLGL